MANRYYEAVHQPTKVHWQPVTGPEVITTPDGKKVVLHPGKHVKILDLVTGGTWMNEAPDFVRRYIGSLSNPGIDQEGLLAFRIHYPDIDIPKE